MPTQLDNIVIDQMAPEWIAVEHYRLHTVEEWPDGPYKEATLAAIHSALAGLLGATPTRSSECIVCSKRRNAPVVIKFPSQSNLAA